MKIHVKTYGCTFNQADSDAIIKRLAEGLQGARFVQSDRTADVVIINSCSVKEATEQKILFEIKRLGLAKKPVVVCGCLAQATPDLVQNANSRAVVVGTFSYDSLSAAVAAALKGEQFARTGRGKELPLVVARDGAVARVQICRGCLGSCSYCSTKLARGGLASHPIKEIVRQVEKAVFGGAREVQLTAQDTGCYGFDLEPGRDLADLLGAVCAIEGDFRVRVGMMNPEHALKILSRLLKAFENQKVYKFLHLPVQSGSDDVLKQMRREYSAKDFLKVVRAFRKKFPGLTLATDVIVGFPTEAGKDFEETAALVRRIRPEVCNVSKYSSRPKTPAHKLRQLPNLQVKRRSEVLSALCRRISLESNEKMVGSERSVLFTGKTAAGISGRAENYKPVSIPAADAARHRLKPGDFALVKITGAGPSHLKAVVL